MDKKADWAVVCSIFALCILHNACAGKSDDGLEIHVKHKPSDCSEVSANGDKVEVHYTGKLEDGKVFDSSIQRNRDPIGLTLGSGQVIEGWEKGLLGMCEGETRNLVIPPHMGYGDSGYPPVIPGGAKLFFEVNLVRLEKRSTPPSFAVINTVKLLALPAAILYIVYYMYTRYKKEMEGRKEEKKKSKKRK